MSDNRFIEKAAMDTVQFSFEGALQERCKIRGHQLCELIHAFNLNSTQTRK